MCMAEVMCQSTSIFSNVIFLQLMIRVKLSTSTLSNLLEKIQRNNPCMNFISVPAPTACLSGNWRDFTFWSLLKPDDYKRFDWFTWGREMWLTRGSKHNYSCLRSKCNSWAQRKCEVQNMKLFCASALAILGYLSFSVPLDLDLFPPTSHLVSSNFV